MIFLDANFLIHLYVEKNKEHKKAKKILKSFGDEEVLISKLVITELITVMNLKLKQDINLILEVYEELNSDYKILIDNDFYDDGLKILSKELKENKKRLPLFDCVYIALMKKLGIKKIATFDKHFKDIDGIEVIDN
ncbi:type II toxin-antitoxin system VapC family toxin [Methanobrevibacter curvatus]|uniref:Ribonuclease VapC n=1 Tax=Methanobrevibacter curvatus TaxID=49547 RepID=A0A166CZM0_9EURY|nr:type II toxin-antitoxin system VapC family toxin [Methanobrevibacter curvatus]KZX15042.1 tRNA(fMet)-specific endonuclease VapC [Methanobrevibacter curvatus]